MKILNFFKLPIETPRLATGEDWDNWHKLAKKAYPIRYYLNDTLPDQLSLINQKLRDIKWWVRYRTTHRYHVIKTGLKPGYYDCDHVLFNTAFTMLVNFVEVEIASKTIAWTTDMKVKYPLPWYNFGRQKIRTKKYPQAALEHLKWEMTLGDHSVDDSMLSQHYIAREIWILYHWWKYIRIMRPDAYEISGLTAWYAAGNQISFTNKNNIPQARGSKIDISTLAYQIEENYEKEDDEMLRRLIKIRRGLWS